MSERSNPPRPAPLSAPSSLSGGRWDELSPGTLFAGKYKIERMIARGGMSGVYLASQLPLHRPVALKILVPLMQDPEGEASFEERFRLEARTLASLNHPNIVHLYDYGETEDGRFYLAMELVDGPRLSDVLKEAGNMDVQRALRVVLHTCAALRYAHNRGVIHRDIKLSNIMLWRDSDGGEQVKVVDFGLVKLKESDQSLTHAGMVLGSPHFIAPEQARGQPVDHRADIYAVGVMLFCLLTGKPPFTGTTATATILAHLTQPIPTLESVAPTLELPAGLEAIVARCLAKRVEERYPDMNHLIADLSALMDGSLPGTLRADIPSSSTIIQLPQLPDEAADRRKKLLVVASVSIVALLLVVSATAIILLTLTEGRLGAPGAAVVAPVSAPAATAPVETPVATPVATPAVAPAAAAPAAAAPAAVAPAAAPASASSSSASTSRARPAPASKPAATPAPASAPAPAATPAVTPAAAPTGEAAGSTPAAGDPGWGQSDLKNPWDDK